MNFFRRRRKKRELEIYHIVSLASQDTIHQMLSAIGIADLEKAIEEAKKADDKYVSLASLYSKLYLTRQKSELNKWLC